MPPTDPSASSGSSARDSGACEVPCPTSLPALSEPRPYLWTTRKSNDRLLPIVAAKCCPFRLIPPVEPPNLADRDVQQARGLCIHQRARHQMVQHEQAPLFRPRQRDPVPLHGRTKSQNC